MSLFRPALVLLLLFTVLTGALYPLLVTGVAQAGFPRQANGSLVHSGAKTVGSDLIGQSFTAPEHFWSRPSATLMTDGSGPLPYNGAASSGSNAGPSNPGFHETVAGRVKALKDADPENQLPIPVDLVTASGSGLDPHISPASAYYQVGRVARARGLAVEQVKRVVDAAVEGRFLGVLGEPRVNVLRLNQALGALPKR